ncbi:MAG: hypothetical protein ACRC7S_14760 [Cetobacterium sp.]
MTKRNYKNVSVNFNLDDEKDKAIYDWLSCKRAKTAFIKDVLEEIMAKTNSITEEPKSDLSKDDLDFDF